MAFTKQDMDLRNSLSVIREIDSDATPQEDVNSGAATLYLISIDNTANAAQKNYLKLYNSLTATVGTTAPDIIIPVPGGSTVTVAMPEGVSFATGLSFATVTTAGTAGATNPTSDVSVVIVVT